jgi:putative transcriptional regulator
MQLQEQFEHVGVIFANLSNWKTSNVKAIRFSSLEDICWTLNGQPGDILEYDQES